MIRFDFDFETFLIVPGCQAPRIVVMSYRVNGGQPRLAHANPAVAGDEFNHLLYWALSNPDVNMRAHNAGGFEAQCIIAHNPAWVGLLADKVDAGLFQCTLVQEKLLRIGKGDHRNGFGLDVCVEAHRLGIKLDKSSPWRTRYGTLWDVPVAMWPQDACAYSLEDTCTYELGEAQERAGQQYLVDRVAQVRAAVSLGSTSAWGIMTDGETAAELVEQTEARLESYRLDLLDPKGRLGLDAQPLLRYEVERGVPKPVKNTLLARERCEAVYRAMGREPPRGEVSPTMLMKAYAAAGLADIGPQWSPEQKKRIKVTTKMLEEAIADGCDSADLIGNISVDKDACYLSRDKLLQAYSAYGQAGTLLSKARRPLLAAKAGMPMQCSYNPVVNTGRTSCRQGEDPEPGEAWTAYGVQIQNLPRAGEVVTVGSDDDGD